MKTITKLSLLFILILAGTGITAAQSYVISGSQTRGVPGRNAELKCQPVKITKTVTLKSVSGDNAGFWISNGSSNVATFWKTNDPSAVGTVLKPGTYYVYPNLKQNQNTATVTIKLE